MKLYDIVVVGAGPVGMMAAIRAGQLGKNVLRVDIPVYILKGNNYRTADMFALSKERDYVSGNS